MSEPRTVRTACTYCGVGCGILARPGADGGATVTGDPDHPANRGRLCSKGAALTETLSLEGRLLHPEIDGRAAIWDDALATVADRFRETIRRHGPGSIAFYVSGQLLTEDYYVANKLMKGYIGSANIDTNSRLCMASAVAGHRRAFGSDTVPGCYEDLEQADLVVLAGSNLAWCHPVLFDRLLAARAGRGTKIVVLDPRRTVTADAADLHLALAPGSDVALFNGLFAWLHDNGASDGGFVERHTSGLEPALACARASTPADVVRWTGLPVGRIDAFYRLFAATPRTVTVYSQGVNQSTSGTDKVNAIINCHLLTGRIGRPGTGPFSVTGQHNAMGGREVGGFANALAAHMQIGNAEHRKRVQSFWRSPAIAEQPGLKAVDLFRAVADGRIRALWVMATNPVASLPDADAVAAALGRCPFVVVSENVRSTGTTRHARVLLPALAWGEKDGTVTNSERRVSRQRRFLPAPGEARPDWWIVCRVARHMGFAGFDFRSPAEIFDEYCRLTALGNDGERALDLSGLAGLGAAGYEALEPVQWPVRVGSQQEPGPRRFFAQGGFFTPDRRARFVPVSPRPPASQTDADYPLILNTGRVRDQWHTMTRTGKAARLSAHVAEPFIEIHPADAARCGIAADAVAVAESARGAVLLRARISERVRPGQVFAPIHWTDEHAAPARVATLVAAHADPVSGQPESKFTPVRVTPFGAAWHAFGVARERPRPGGDLFTICSGPALPVGARPTGDSDVKHRIARETGSYWAVARAAGGWRIELAGRRGPADWGIAAGLIFGCDVDREDTLALNDPAMGVYRLAIFDGDRLRAVLFVSREPVMLSRAWAIEQLSRAFSTDARLLLLAAGRTKASANDGEILCACMHVGANEITAAVARGARTVAEVGTATRAGTNCGSCRPEIAGIIEGNRVQAAG